MVMMDVHIMEIFSAVLLESKNIFYMEKRKIGELSILTLNAIVVDSKK